MSISLKTGWNDVVYTGKAQLSLDALASIAPYLIEAAWYWNNYTYAFEIMRTPGIPPYDRDTMVPYGCYWIEITQDCTWEYGEDAPPPSSVQLYGGRGNYVPYLGAAQPSLTALASLEPYGFISAVFYWNNDTYAWEIMRTPGIPIWDRDIMVPYGVYWIEITQDCVWTFGAAPVIAGELASAFVWWEGLPDWLEIWGEWDPRWIDQTNTWPANTDIQTAWTVKNTGNQTAFFKVKFMGLTSAGVQLSAGETASVYLYPTTPGAGTYSYTLDVIADSQVVETYPISVTITGAVPKPEFANFGISDYSKA